MEYAEIKEIETSPRKGDPGALSVDDLVMEIGKMHLQKISLNRQLEIMAKMAPVFAKQSPKDESELKKSNKLFEENNRQLGNQLVKSNNARDAFEIANKKLEKSLEVKRGELERVIKAHNEALRISQGVIDERDKTIVKQVTRLKRQDTRIANLTKKDKK